MVPNVALRAGEVRHSGTPAAGIGGANLDVSRHLGPGELPGPDALVAQFNGEEATAGLVEPGPKGIVDVAADVAAGVVLAAAVAVGLGGGARHDALDTLHGAAARRVQRLQVAVGGAVHGLHDVNLAVARPLGQARQPQRRPCAAAVRRVLDVKYEEPAVVLPLRLDADRHAALGDVGEGVGT